MSSTYLIFGNGFIATHLAWDILKKEKSVSVVGHKNISTTQKYIEVNDTMLKRAVELV